AGLVLGVGNKEEAVNGGRLVPGGTARNAPAPPLCAPLMPGFCHISPSALPTASPGGEKRIVAAGGAAVVICFFNHPRRRR
ncbi:cobalt-precorrin-3B C(17)-methyltransferase, partial [Klebsiella pneumoniae]|nr:cobalt-precorrin-3B C(17)-methyltransferase [Klebsiella pneumoniae]